MRNASGQTGMTDQQFIALWKDTGGRAKLVAENAGMTLRNVYDRRAKIEKRHTVTLPSAGDGGKVGRGDAGIEANNYLQRLTIDNFTGTVVVSSDHHYWPGQPPSIAHKALVEVIKEVKPKLNILNGDVFDGARLSRFPRNGWEEQPRVSDELEEAKERAREIEHAALRAEKLRTLGNHCIRFDRYLAMNASEMEGIQGMRLADHLPAWKECVSVFINGHTMVKHRIGGGVHAAYTNLMKAGTSGITGHTHHLEVRPWGDYRGRRYWAQGGAIADVQGQQFAYTEDNPTPWCSGFVVATFDSAGRLMMPELCEVIDGVAYFRGQRVVGQRRRAAA